MRALPAAVLLCAALLSARAQAAQPATPAALPDEPAVLTIADAVQLAVRNNVSLRLAEARAEEAKGRVLQEASRLLPSLLGSASQSRVFRENLAALGFTDGGLFPLTIGPFDVFDARLRLSQSLFDWSSLKLRRSAEHRRRAAELSQALIEDQVAAAAALACVEVLRARNVIEAALAGDELAKSLLSLAQDRHKVGSATGVDVARAQTREAQERLRVLEARLAASEADLRLKHVAGLPLSRPVVLKETLALSSAPLHGLEESLAAADGSRLELSIAGEALRAESAALAAARGQRLPVVGTEASAAWSGSTPDTNARLVGDMGVGLSVPLFAGGAISGRIEEAAGAAREAEARLSDTRVQVEEEVRLALDRLLASVDRVRTARQALDLAETELRMARDRFAAGVGDNVEVVNAQTVLASTQDTLAAALAQHQAARVNMALATGAMRRFKL